MDHGVAAFSLNAINKLDNMIWQNMNLKKQNVIKELNLEVNKSVMDQILVLSNDRFR